MVVEYCYVCLLGDLKLLYDKYICFMFLVFWDIEFWWLWVGSWIIGMYCFVLDMFLVLRSFVFLKIIKWVFYFVGREVSLLL